MDKIDASSLYESNTTEAVSSQTESTGTTESMTTPEIGQLSRDATAVTAAETTALTTTEGGTTVVTATTESEEAMTPLDKFTTTTFATEKTMETTLEAETETTKLVTTVFTCSVHNGCLTPSTHIFHRNIVSFLQVK